MFTNAIGSRTEGHGFALLRKKKAENAYRKLKAKEALVARKRDDGHASETRATAVTGDEEESPSEETRMSRKKKPVKGNPYLKAQLSSQVEKSRRGEQQKEKERVQQERREALERYAARKRVRNKKLCKKNYKGQPILSNQMDLLLEKIMASVPPSATSAASTSTSARACKS